MSLDVQERVVDDLVERGGLAAGERDDPGSVDRVLVREPGEQRNAGSAVAELARGGRGERVGCARFEPLRVGHRERAAAPIAGQFELVLVVDHLASAARRASSVR